jgi:hypothetical protein
VSFIPKAAETDSEETYLKSGFTSLLTILQKYDIIYIENKKERKKINGIQ